MLTHETIPRKSWRIGLFAKIALVFAPVFMIVAALGIWMMFQSTTVDSVDALSARIGSSAARVSAALMRHGKDGSSSDPWVSPLPREMLNTLLADDAIRCIIFTREDAPGTRLIAPRGLGCTGQNVEARFSIPFSTGGVPSTLEIGFDRSEIAEKQKKWLNLSVAALVSGLLLSLIAGWIAFRIFVRTPLIRLLIAIDQIKRSAVFEPVVVNQRDELGTVIAAFNKMQARDHRNTQMLEQERARFSRVIDSMIDGLLVIDREMRVVMVNKASCELLHRPEQALIGKSVLTLFRPVDHDAMERVCLLEAILPDDRAVPVQTSVSSMSFDEETATVCVFRDISEAIEREAKIQQTTLEALTANRAKTEFLTNMSHELRTPLNAIIGFSQIMADGTIPTDDKQVVEYAGHIHSGGTHLLSIINDILDISKIEAGEVKFQPGPIDLARIFVSVDRISHVHALERDVSLKVNAPHDDVTFVADELRLKQILINLVGNAIKFTESGGTVTVTAQNEDGTVRLQVEDTGIGMTQGEIEEAMKPFRQVDNTQTRAHEGTGLGLPLSKSLVDMQGGTFEIHSLPGRGTTVSVCFPSDQPAHGTSDTEDAQVRRVA